MKNFGGWPGAIVILSIFIVNELVLFFFVGEFELIAFIYTTIRWPFMLGVCAVHSVLVIIKTLRTFEIRSLTPIVVSFGILAFVFSCPYPLFYLFNNGDKQIFEK